MDEPSPIVRLPLVAMAAVLAGLTLVALLIASDSHLASWGWYRFGFFAIPAVVAVYYLSQYRKLPYEPWHFFPPQPAPAAPAPPPPAPAPAPAPASPAPSPPSPRGEGTRTPEVVEVDRPDDDSSEDPVEEADRLEREAAERRTKPPTGGDETSP